MPLSTEPHIQPSPLTLSLRAQPWTPTKALPHPLACLPYRHSRTWSIENRVSYQVTTPSPTSCLALSNALSNPYVIPI